MSGALCIQNFPAVYRNNSFIKRTETFQGRYCKDCSNKSFCRSFYGIGDHESKYAGEDDAEAGDEQFEISDARSFDQMYGDMEGEGLQPVLNDYVYVG
mgnify:CR=1 FL=1